MTWRRVKEAQRAGEAAAAERRLMTRLEAAAATPSDAPRRALRSAIRLLHRYNGAGHWAGAIQRLQNADWAKPPGPEGRPQR